MNPSECKTIRPLLFAALENQTDDDERVRVTAHLAVCEDCRSFERAERAVTDLLDRDEPDVYAPRHSLARFAMPLAIAATVLLLVLILPAATPRGSIIERRLATSTEVEQFEAAVATSNHLFVGRNGAVGIRLTRGVHLEASGPAQFELDQIGDDWKIVILEGRVRVTLREGRALVAVHRGGRTALGAGTHVLTSDGIAQDQDPQVPRDVATLIQAGQEAFYASSAIQAITNAPEDQQNMRTAEGLFRKALADERITPDQRNTALFYLSASLGRQERNAEAIEVSEKWLVLHPDDPQRHYVRFCMAANHEDLGHHDEAKRIWREVVEEAPESSIAGHAQAYIDTAHKRQTKDRQEPAQKLRAPRPPIEEKRASYLPARKTVPGPYLVVATDLADSDAGFRNAAEHAAKHHEAEILEWDGRDFDALARELAQRRPENVLFVLEPDTLDINLHRLILLHSARLDDDWFVDFAFGYLTARDGDGAAALWNRIAELHAEGLASKEWVESSITSSAQSLEYAHSVPPIAKAAGFDGTHYYPSIHDPDQSAFVDKALAGMTTASVLQFTGNGDPQGIWLFDDQRNVDRSKHWKYAPDKVGHDPDGAMPRIMAAQFRETRFASPIVWSGTCHSAATGRVFVEGDIVSTFGRTDGIDTVHRLAPDDSLCLAWIEAGAAALLAPIAANHGMSVSMETDFALRHGASLGEIVKSTWDDVLLAADGELRLHIATPGKRQGRDGYVMQGGGANRILIGDPALRPFTPTADPGERVTIEPRDDGFAVIVDREAGFSPRGWDIFGTDRAADWRVLTRVDLANLAPNDRAVGFSTEIHATDLNGEPLPFRATKCSTEEYHGRRYLHLQANAPRAAVQRKAARLEFRVTVR